MAAQPVESKSQKRMKWLRKMLVVPGIKENELCARAGKIKFAPTCRQIAYLIHAYPGTTREPRLVFELLAPKADKADVRANRMLVVNKLTKKFGETCGEAYWVFRDADPEETIEAYALRHFGIDASPATPVAPTPEREVPPSLKPSVQSAPDAASPARIVYVDESQPPADATTEVELVPAGGVRPSSLALAEPPASDPKVEALSAFDVPPPAPTPTVSAAAPSAEAPPTSVDENAELRARVAALEAGLEATKMCKTAEPASLAPAVSKIEMPRVVSATTSPTAVEVPAAELTPTGATLDADAHKEAIGADTTSLTPREDTQPCTQPRGASLGDVSAAADSVDEQAAEAVVDQTEGLAMSDNQPSTGVVLASEDGVKGVEESKEEPKALTTPVACALAKKCIVCSTDVRIDMTYHFPCCVEKGEDLDGIYYCDVCVQEAVENGVCTECLISVSSDDVMKGLPSATTLLSPPKFTPNEPVEKTCRVVALGPPDSERPETPAHASPKKEDSPDEPRKLDLEADMQEELRREVREGTVDLKKTGDGPMKMVETKDQPVEPPVTALQSGTLSGDAAKAAFEKRFSDDGSSPIAEAFSSPEPVTSPKAPLNDTNRVDQTPPREPPKERSWSPFRCAQK